MKTTFKLIDRIIPYSLLLIGVYLSIILGVTISCAGSKDVNAEYRKEVVNKTNR